MTAFTSNGTGGGDWNALATWTNGVNYPFELSAADTFTIAAGDTITTTADNPFAGTGAGSISGTLICNHNGSAQNFCGAITTNSGGTLSSASNQNTKVLRAAGNVTIAAGGTYHGYEDFTLIIASTGVGTYTFTNAVDANFYMVGSSGHVSRIQGDGSGKEMKCVIYGGSVTAIIHIDYADFQWGVHIDA